DEGTGRAARFAGERGKADSRRVIDDCGCVAETARRFKNCSGNRRRQHDDTRIQLTKVLCFFLSRKKILLF
ncbi:MAG TPA: hypothetical protein VMB71_07120, partial [Acetobacteraceae bacterium]|nr:hypothetical protein [Acetobacteraceae bacterium]